MPQVVNLIQLSKPPVDKIRKYWVEEFRATTDDDVERAEFWLENTIRVFDEMACTLDELADESEGGCLCHFVEEPKVPSQLSHIGPDRDDSSSMSLYLMADGKGNEVGKVEDVPVAMLHKK